MVRKNFFATKKKKGPPDKHESKEVENMEKTVNEEQSRELDFENNISSKNMVAEKEQITEETDKSVVADNGLNIPSQTKELEENKDNLSKDDNVAVRDAFLLDVPTSVYHQHYTIILRESKTLRTSSDSR